MADLATPTLPPLPSSGLEGLLPQLPVRLTIDPLILAVLLALIGIFVAVLSVMLVYHWRRFPFEHDLFHRVERFYMVGVFMLLATALVGILMS